MRKLLFLLFTVSILGGTKDMEQPEACSNHARSSIIESKTANYLELVSSLIRFKFSSEGFNNIAKRGLFDDKEIKFEFIETKRELASNERVFKEPQCLQFLEYMYLKKKLRLVILSIKTFVEENKERIERLQNSKEIIDQLSEYNKSLYHDFFSYIKLEQDATSKKADLIAKIERQGLDLQSKLVQEKFQEIENGIFRFLYISIEKYYEEVDNYLDEINRKIDDQIKLINDGEQKELDMQILLG